MDASDSNENSTELLQLIEVLLDKSQQDTPEAKESLSSLFDLLLWAEKRSESTLQSVITSKLMVILLEKYKTLTDLLLSGYILLLGNAKDEGLLVTHLLENHLPDRVLTIYLTHISSIAEIEEEQHLHLIGSYLKAYHRHLTANNLPYFIEDDRCLLITICCQFFNCPEEITRTSIMNILMNILKLPLTSKLLVYLRVRGELRSWCLNMCRLLRNQLKDFDQNLLTTEQSESQYIIHLINDKIFLWEDLSELSEQLFSQAFYHQIIIPLVIGSLNTNGIPLFTLKFALFILNKLIKTIKNLDLLNELGSLLFVGQEVTYKDSQLATASLKPFNLHKIVSRSQSKQENSEEDESNEFKQVNQLFFNILRSKDSRFLECVCILILNILTEVKRSPKHINFFIKELGFGIDGFNIITISQILINQFNAIHTLEINKMICSLLIYIQPTKYLTDEVKYRFTHVYRQHVDEAIMNIDKYKDKYDYICEVLEYDAKTISSNSFNFQMEIKTDAALIFNNEIIDNEVQPFYRQIPETDHNLLRYNLVKTLLLRKLAVRVIEECSVDKSFQKYLDKVRQTDAAYIKPGEYLKLPINYGSYRCKLVDEKIQIPNCLMLQDESNLIVGYLENMQIKIILNIKMKHITPLLKTKKDKIYADIDIRKYDHQLQDIIQMRGIMLKYIETGMEYFKNKKGKIKEKEIASIREILRNAKSKIPQISLI